MIWWKAHLQNNRPPLRCSLQRRRPLTWPPLQPLDEGDKIRTIYDGSAGGANIHIQNQTMERTTAPTVLDCVPSTPLATRSKQLTTTHGPLTCRTTPPKTHHWQWPKPKQWFLLKADVTKAHRRVKVLQRDWRFPSSRAGRRMVDQQGRHLWNGKCSTILGAETAALILRLLYNLFSPGRLGICLC